MSTSATETDRDTARAGAASSWLAGLGLTAGLAALLASSCCAVPLALVGLGASSAWLANLAVLASLRPFLLLAAGLALVAAWLGWWRARACSAGACARPKRTSGGLAVLVAGTLALGLAVLWAPLVEPRVVPWLR